jgi:hypothetical protein
MDRQKPARPRLIPGSGRIIALAVALSPCISVGAQTRSARDTVTAYGARLNAKGEPVNLNPNRINNRVNSRIDTRLSLRIERYRTDSTTAPVSAFSVRQTDNARVGTDTTLSSLSATSSKAALQAYEGPSQSSTRPAADAARPRQ